jgi:hypothetical protein
MIVILEKHTGFSLPRSLVGASVFFLQDRNGNGSDLSDIQYPTKRNKQSVMPFHCSPTGLVENGLALAR